MNQTGLQLDFSQALQGRLAWVTGASRGIGQSVADILARAGATVVGTATTAEGAAAITGRLVAATGVGCGQQLDVCDPAAIQVAGAWIQQTYGRMPDILIHNAGITRDQLLIRMTDADWDAVVDTHLTALFHLSRLCVKAMMKNRYGRIVAMGSVVGSAGQAGQANYAATKAGMVGFVKALSQEVAPRGITVNAVAPGFIQTEMTGKLPPAQQERIVARIPMGTMGVPEDVAAAVLYLVSDWARYVTGATLHVNGGMYCAG